MPACGRRSPTSTRSTRRTTARARTAKSIDDFFGPEIDSQAVEPNGVPYSVDGAWTDDNAATKQYDSYKVQAVINWINGYNHSGTGPIAQHAIAAGLAAEQRLLDGQLNFSSA